MKYFANKNIVFVALAVCLHACQPIQTNPDVTLPDPSNTTKMDDYPNEDRSGCVISSPPGKLRLHPFYKKYCDAGGIPVISSGEVEDRALKQAYYLIMNLLAPIPQVREELLSRRHYFAIVGISEELTMLPEYSHMDSETWDQRARGLGGSRFIRITSSPEENLICFRRDRYYGESILIHEFAHTIHLAGLGSEYRAFTSELEGLFKSAKQQGLWHDTYAGSDILEYWAEGVQSYFNANLESNPADGIHNQVNTREELALYDSALYDFISRFFYNYKWTPTCPGSLQGALLSSFRTVW